MSTEQPSTSSASTPTEYAAAAALAARNQSVEDEDQDEEENAAKEEEDVPSISLLDITEGDNERGIPKAKFIDDVGSFSVSFQPEASAEILIGAYSDLRVKYRTYEAQLQQRQGRLKDKVPELEKSLSLVRTLLEKQERAQENEDDDSLATGIARFSLADNIYAKAELDYKNNNIVNLWLGANVMLEFTYQEAIDFLSQNQERAKKEYKETLIDLAFVRDQIVTSEVTVSRIFNWDVRRKRLFNSKDEGNTSATTAAVATKPPLSSSSS